jgi:mRNA interferase RelE/StbE
MAAYRVDIDRPAMRDLAKLPLELRSRIVARIQALGADPRPRGARKLTGSTDRYRIRVGDYRVLYRVDDDVLLVLVVAVALREHVYRRH